jgi:hypothetical protein
MLDLGLDIKVVKLLEDTKDNVKNTPLLNNNVKKLDKRNLFRYFSGGDKKSITYSKKKCLQLV